MARRKSWVPDPAEQYGDDTHDDYQDDYYEAEPEGALAASGLVRTLRALSGAVAAGLVLLTLVVVVVGIIGGQRGFPGPGAVSIGVHIAGSVLALLCQRVADRRRNFAAPLASLLVLAIAAGVLWTQWWN